MMQLPHKNAAKMYLFHAPFCHLTERSGDKRHDIEVNDFAFLPNKLEQELGTGNRITGWTGSGNLGPGISRLSRLISFHFISF